MEPAPEAKLLLARMVLPGLKEQNEEPKTIAFWEELVAEMEAVVGDNPKGHQA